MLWSWNIQYHLKTARMPFSLNHYFGVVLWGILCPVSGAVYSNKRRITITNSNINYVCGAYKAYDMYKSSFLIKYCLMKLCRPSLFSYVIIQRSIIHWFDIIAVMARPMYRYALPGASSDQFAQKHCKVTFILSHAVCC